MTAIAHFIAIVCYFGAAALAATPFARPVGAPVRGVLALLSVGVATHAAALLVFVSRTGEAPLAGIGPTLSSTGFAIAAALLVVEIAVNDVSLTVVMGPLAATPTLFANLIGLAPSAERFGPDAGWVLAHAASSVAGLALFALAGAAGGLYLVELRVLQLPGDTVGKRFFPSLATLERVNHVAAIAGAVGLTLGVLLAVPYALRTHELRMPKLVWATGAWLSISVIAVGRTWGRWPARRAAICSSVSFAAVVVLYVALRIAEPNSGGRFL